MSTADDRWELGSAFHWLEEGGQAHYPWDRHSYSLWASGRAAVAAAVGASRRLWVPSYYCQEAIDRLPGLGIELRVYDDDPIRPMTMPPASARDAVIVVNTLGLRARGFEPRADVTLIEDHTHDPWSSWASTSRADYCVASLRKTLPVPDGGVVWSPAGHPLLPPPAPAPLHLAAVLDRLSAMVLKTRYMSGEWVAKDAFLGLAGRAEKALGDAPPGGISPITAQILGAMPTTRWRERRIDNFGVFARVYGRRPGARLLAPAEGTASFAATLCFDAPAVRDAVRERLIARRVYPTVLWPLERTVAPAVPASSIDLSRRLLSIHCDQRYPTADMERATAIVVELVDSCASS